MSPRFTMIQGGLPETAPREISRAPLSLVTETEFVQRLAPQGWRVLLRRPSELREAEIEEWRAFAARSTGLDPFADPDFLVTAALHESRGNGGGMVFALAYFQGENGIERLRGVIPLSLPHAVWGGPAVSLWQAPLTPHPMEPVFDEGAAGDAIEAVLGHLTATNPRAKLHFSGLTASGDLLAGLRADPRFQVEDRESPAAIPEGQFVSVAARETVTRVERITSPDEIRDAVERFLLVDAQRSRRPLLPDPAAASTVRVVTRLLARRGLVEVELNSAFGQVVSGAIRLGREGERKVWRAVDLDAASPAQGRTVDVVVAAARSEERLGTVRLG